MIYRLITLMLLAAPGLQAVEGAAYLKGAEGPRSQAMGGAFSAAGGSAESIWYNPAGLTGLKGAEGSFGHHSIAGGFDADHILAAAFLGWQQSLGLVYSRKAASDSYRDGMGNAAGSFEVSNSVLGLGWAYDFNSLGLSLGWGAKMLGEKVADLSASSMVFDFGLQGNLSKDRVLWGLSLLNLGPAPQIGSLPPGMELKAPTLLRAGAGFQAGEPAQSFLLLGDFRYLAATGRTGFALGAEYAEVYADNSLALRAGYDFGGNALGGLTGLSLGAGFGYKWLGVDYSYLPLDVLGASHRVSLTLTYDQKAEAQEKSLTDFLGLTAAAQAQPTATPLPTSTPIRALSDRPSGLDLDALLAATPTPMQSPTPAVSERPKEEARGLIGAIVSIFSFGKKKEERPGDEPVEKPKRPGGILKGFFSIFGLGEEDELQELPDQPGVEPAVEDEDRFSDDDAFLRTPRRDPAPTPVPGAMREAEPTPEPTPVAKKIKRLLSF